MQPGDYKFGLITLDDWFCIYKALFLLRKYFKVINIFEVGCRTCLTGIAISQVCKDINLAYNYYGIDIKQNPPRNLLPHMKFFRADANNEAFLEYLPPKLHFIFHDACHCKDCVKRTFRLYTPRLVPDGIIAFHDTAPRQQGVFIPESHSPGRDIRCGVSAALKDLRMTKLGYTVIDKTSGTRGIKVYLKGPNGTTK